MAASLNPQQAKDLIESSGRIHIHDFRVLIGVLTGFALGCFFIRTAIRLTYQKQLRIDDAFLILASCCLCAATGILYHICYFLYLHTATLLEPQLLPYLLENFSELLNLQKQAYPFLLLIWTTTFAVKGCFLAFMRPLVWHISLGMNRYYWFVVVFCTISWAFVESMPFIICPYFGADAIKCFTSTVDSKMTYALTILVTVLDLLSDIMVVSIPIIVLRHSLLSRSTKFGLAIFLCLSIFMAICAIIRLAGYHYHGLEDDTWQFLWQHVEGAISVMMASITAFRTLFVKQTNNSEENSGPHNPVESLFWHRLFKRFQALARARPSGEKYGESGMGGGERLKLPKMPSPVFTGMRSFIRRNGRSAGGGETFATLNSVGDGMEADYHATLLEQERAGSRKTSSHGPSSHTQSSSGRS